MTNFKNILFPTDGSKEAGKALNYVKEMALKFGSTVTVLHSYDFSGIIGGYEITPVYLLELDKSLQESGQKIITEAVIDLAGAGVETKSILAKGDAPYTIEETVEKENIDLVIMGSRGLGNLKGFLLGSVSNHVLHHVKCPVLLVH